MITAPNNIKEKQQKDKSSRAIIRVGQSVNLAVERFVTVGETIADDNPEIKVDMYEACKEARAASTAIEKLCELQYNGQQGMKSSDKASLIRAAKCLLSSITRVLLLADTVVVKQLLLFKDKIPHPCSSRLDGVNNFTEFVKAFSHFGTEMVELASSTNDRFNEQREERRRAQMTAARLILERSAMMLLTSSKMCLRHNECSRGRENRDTVFCQMRRAIDLIHFVVKDSVVLPSGQSLNDGRANGNSAPYISNWKPKDDDYDSPHSIYFAVKRFQDLVESTRVTMMGSYYRDKLTEVLENVIERTQDFTDSAYTCHEHRENILLLCDRIKLELNHLLRVGVSLDQKDSASPSPDLESAVAATVKATTDLRNQLRKTGLDQAADLLRGTTEDTDLLSAMKSASCAGDSGRLDEFCDRFSEHAEHLQEVCKLLRHISPTETLHVAARYTEVNLRIYGPQIITAATALCLHPSSKISKENFEAFSDMWQSLVNDVTNIARDVSELAKGKPVEKKVYTSLPRPGKHGTTTKPPKPVKLDSEEQAKIAKTGLEMKEITSEMDAETEKWMENAEDEENNDIVKRAKNMSSMAFAMYQFTRGEGALKTTQDLFTQAEYFAEEANRLYKVVRQFSYQVPAGILKKQLMELLDKVPTYVQQLQFLVKNPTVGKAATFTKVDAVIQETKNLMNVISKVVTMCFQCASKYNLCMPERFDSGLSQANLGDYKMLDSLDVESAQNLGNNSSKFNLDFRGLSPKGRNNSMYRDGDDFGGVGSETKLSGSSSSDPNI